MPGKRRYSPVFRRCVRKVKAKRGPAAYPICMKSVGRRRAYGGFSFRDAGKKVLAFGKKYAPAAAAVAALAYGTKLSLDKKAAQRKAEAARYRGFHEAYRVPASYFEPDYFSEGFVAGQQGEGLRRPRPRSGRGITETAKKAAKYLIPLGLSAAAAYKLYQNLQGQPRSAKASALQVAPVAVRSERKRSYEPYVQYGQERKYELGGSFASAVSSAKKFAAKHKGKLAAAAALAGLALGVYQSSKRRGAPTVEQQIALEQLPQKYSDEYTLAVDKVWKALQAEYPEARKGELLLDAFDRVDRVSA